MLEISLSDIEKRIRRDNPWWTNRAIDKLRWSDLIRRDYFEAFYKLTTNWDIIRSTVLLGPRRVGKTVMLHHFIYELTKSGTDPTRLLYVSIDTPVYAELRLEKILEIFLDINTIADGERCYVIFDEIQYLRDWEVHLKDLTDSYPQIRFVASGSAAAALRLQSRESGAGRFSDFLLPPLTFREFCKFIGKYDNCVSQDEKTGHYTIKSMTELNKCFINYINFGGFPEVALDEQIRNNLDSFIKADIIDKVLLKDLPNLYGIQNIQDLNNIFKLLAYNNGQEVGLEAISQQSKLPKAMIKNFIEYLDSAFLISQHDKLPTTGKHMVRKRNFKVYLTNPSMRAALFSPIDESETSILGHLAEAAILSQWDHFSRTHNRYYYRDANGVEVDIVGLQVGTFKPSHPVEIKWSDSYMKDPRTSLRGLLYFMKKYELKEAIVTSKTQREIIEVEGKTLNFIPTSLYCLSLGSVTSRMAIESKMAGGL